MGRYLNPILPGSHPDPTICRVGEWYYLVTSTLEYLPGLPVHASTNLVDWELVGHVIDRPGQLDLAGLPSSHGLYAPTIRHHDGTFYLVCTVVGPASDGGAAWTGRSGHFLVTAADPRGPWSDPIWLEGRHEIDPSLTFDSGRVWLCGTRQARPGGWPGQNDVWLRELDPSTFEVIGPETLLWHGALEGARYAEGPHLYRHPDGGWLMVAAEGGTFGDHAVTVAYADEITGPYRGDAGNPRLTHRDLGSRAEIGEVGHADLVEASDGRTWATLLATHAVDGVDGLLGRQTHLVPVEWEDGRPLFAPGSGRVERVVDAGGVPDQALRPTVLRDDFDTPERDPEWNGVRHFPSEFADLTARRGHLRLSARASEPSESGMLAFLGRRLPTARGVVRARLELAPDGVLRAGILLRTTDRAYFEVTVNADGVARALIVEGGNATTLGDASCDPSAPLDLRLGIDGFRGDAFVGDIHIATVDLRELRTGRSGMFLGCWVGPFAVGSGHADVDVFEISGCRPQDRLPMTTGK